MNFYWKDEKDQVSYVCTPHLNLMPTTLSQLYVRHGSIPASVDGVVDPWTIFRMTLREPGPIPATLELTRFLASSITFMTHLSEVSVYFDNKQLVRLSKNRGVSKKVPMLRGLKGTSLKGMMNVKSIETTRKLVCCSFRKNSPIPLLDSSSYQGGSGSTGIHRWHREAFRYIQDRYPKDRVASFIASLQWY
jgi:hypothetical protein